MILGLPELTVFAVGGTIIVVLLLLILWGIFYPKMED